jgi:hypothetical protein
MLAAFIVGPARAGELPKAQADGKQSSEREIAKRKIRFANLEWDVKGSGDSKRVGPGPNYFSDSTNNVYLDESGRLHLRITHSRESGGRIRWWCAEVICSQPLGEGYGDYCWQIDSPLTADPNIVFGLFTWDTNAAEENHREIDIELISTWGGPSSEANAQYVVQPWDVKGRRKRWRLDSSPISTHTFNWRPNSIQFLSIVGLQETSPVAATPAQTWTFSGKDVPHHGGERVRMNLWLLGPPAQDAKECEVVIGKFEFNPVGVPDGSPASTGVGSSK